MANSKEVAQIGSLCSPGFIEELLPCSQQISLLYHISYLCLAKFPQVEKLLRMRAVETQDLFGSSEALLFKCVGTSQNLISSLFPMLILAIKENEPELAENYLKKARTWITEIIKDVDKMVERYGAHNGDMASTTSDIITEKTETEKQLKQLSKEINEMKNTLTTLDNQLCDTTKELEEKEKQFEAKNRELQDLVRSATSKSNGLGIFAAIVPFIGVLVLSIYETVTGPGVAEKTKALEAEMNRLSSEKNSLKQKEWDLQVQIMDRNMKLAKLNMEQGVIPDPVHLGEVQRYLTKIQSILLKLKGFWENVNSLLGTIKDKTFVNEDLVKCPKFQAEFVRSIQKASEAWGQFGGGCLKGVQIFRVQSKDAYKFLEINPASLSQEVWQKEYDRVKEGLRQLKVCGEEAAPAIQQ